MVPDALPNDDWCYIYQQHVYPLIDEEKFRHLYSEHEGRSNAPIKIMVSLLIFMGIEKLTWRSVVFQFPRRLDWLIATRTALGDAQIDHTILFKAFVTQTCSEQNQTQFITDIQALEATASDSGEQTQIQLRRKL